jgi:hypothetical protein
MSTPAIRGNAIVYGADGDILLAGTAIYIMGQSAEVKNADATAVITDGQGKIATLVNKESIKHGTFKFIPSGAGNKYGTPAHTNTLASAAATAILIPKFSQVVTSGFPGNVISGGGPLAPDYNDTWYVMEDSHALQSEGALIYTLELQNSENFNAANKAAWATALTA